jgi:dTDP-4-dehydrorhamnose 3,5-epimerase-like enzyme
LVTGVQTCALPILDRSIYYADRKLNIDWKLSNVILSDKDKNAPLLKDSDINFK